MGTGYLFSCDKCHFNFLATVGTGMFFPRLYQETITKARKGRLGSTVKRFLLDHPDGALDCGAVVLRCEACGELRSTLSLDMYIPKKEGDGPSPFGGDSYVACCDLLDFYDLVQRFPHKCGKCNSRMKAISHLKEYDYGYEDEIEKENLICPYCKKQLVMTEVIKWD